jgi:hypothetical protein
MGGREKEEDERERETDGCVVVLCAKDELRGAIVATADVCDRSLPWLQDLGTKRVWEGEQ